MSWYWRRELWRGLSRVAEMNVLALDMRLIQLLMGKYREWAGCPLERDILDGRQSNGYQDPTDHGMSPVSYKWNYISMLAESSIPYVLYTLGPLPSAPVPSALFSYPCLFQMLLPSPKCQRYHWAILNYGSHPPQMLVWALTAQDQRSAHPCRFQWFCPINMDFWRKY